MEKTSLKTTRAIVFLILGYQRYIGPQLGNHCRFHPSCSHYAKEAIIQYGALQGSWITIKRLLRCHPFHPGGYDPVKNSHVR